MEWIEINVEIPDAIARDAIVNRLFELGAEGVDEGDPKRVKGFFQPHLKEDVEREVNRFVASLRQLNPESHFGEVHVSRLPDQNWADEYKKHYRAQPFARSFFLIPAWEPATRAPEGKHPIILEPGRAFGTGIHASTQLCASLFELVLERLPAAAGLRLLDLGTGTGILAMTAHKLGVGKIVAIDNDPEAVEVAQENFVMNRCLGIDLSARDVARETIPFDIMLCNILLETHRELAPVYRRLLAPSGVLIVSGLLGHQRAEMDECFAAQGLVPDAAASLQEWTSIAYVSSLKGGSR